ncbi:MAG TPA: 23S rRNA (adenine(1618)-N(6))-methyltransferase RlmF [Gallionella sp.]|nr:23S rRNA (adenine(1618)-N(6))-methyltransferase RlmF [Gallionella sp.]
MKNRQRGAHTTKGKAAPAEKDALHPRNPHRGRCDFTQLIAASPALAPFVATNAYGDASINFSDPAAVKALNRALLQQVYGIGEWDIPPQYLCPPIPGRADYLHWVADLLAESNGGVIPRGATVQVLDIGVGANCIYPLIGQREYGWRFAGSDIDAVAIANAQRIVDANGLGAAITLRLQASPAAIFKGVVQADEVFDLTLCNPPFHASLAEAAAGTQRKWKNLGRDVGRKKPVLNFGGQGAELYCEGGEEAFVRRMIAESAELRGRCMWFTTLVSKSASLPAVYRALKQAGALQHKTIEMAQGQKRSRFVAWTFLDDKQRRAWSVARGQASGADC